MIVRHFMNFAKVFSRERKEEIKKNSSKNLFCGFLIFHPAIYARNDPFEKIREYVILIEFCYVNGIKNVFWQFL